MRDLINLYFERLQRNNFRLYAFLVTSYHSKCEILLEGSAVDFKVLS